MSGDATAVQNIPIVALPGHLEAKDHAPDTSDTSINERTDDFSAPIPLNVPNSGDLSTEDRFFPYLETIPHSPSEQHGVSQTRGQDNPSVASAAPPAVTEETTSDSPANFPWWKKLILVACISIIRGPLSQVGSIVALTKATG